MDAQCLPNWAVSSIRADEVPGAYLLNPTAGTMDKRREHVILALLEGRELRVEAELCLLISSRVFEEPRLDDILG
jgi:hypothetical protein